MLNYRFKAKNVPATVTNMNYNNIVLRVSKADKKVDFEPNLYDKHKDKLRPKEDNEEVNREVNQKFRSKPLPSFYSNITPYTNIEKQKLAEKEKRITERKEQLLKEAALPPRMETAFKNDVKTSMKIEDLKNKLFSENHTFKPKINKNVPKFEFDKPLELKAKPKRPQSLVQTQNYMNSKAKPLINQNIDPNDKSGASGFLTIKNELFAQEEVLEGDQMVIQRGGADMRASDEPQILLRGLGSKLKAHISAVQHKSTKKDELMKQKLDKENQLKEEKIREEKEKTEEIIKNRKEAAKLFREGFKNVSKSVEMTKDGLKSKIFLFEANGGYSKAVLYYEKLLKAKDGGIGEQYQAVSIADDKIHEVSMENMESDIEEFEDMEIEE